MSGRARFLRAAAGIALVVPTAGCAALEGIARGAGAAPTTAEIAAGLEQALSQGAARAVAELARDGGYLRDPAVRIGFPDAAAPVADGLRRIGLGSLVDRFEARLNRGAEEGASQALAIFENAIASMTFADATAILLGDENAATEYFRARTYDSLAAAFAPRVRAALEQVGATALWSEVTTAYNRIPLAPKVETDIVAYTTARALDGLFVKLAAEEARIRAEPIARTTELLRRVFDYAVRRKSAG